MEKEKYYNPKRLLSYQDCVVLMSVGARGIGKTFGIKSLMINEYIKKGKQSVYMRRNDTDLKNMDTFMDDIASVFPYYEFRKTSNTIDIKHVDAEEWETFIYLMALTTVKRFKGPNFPKVAYVVFDEFIIDDRDKRSQRYLPNELECFADLVETVSRTRDVKIIMLSNALSTNNPYFIQFDIESPKPGTITKKIIKEKIEIDGEIFTVDFRMAIELPNSSEYAKEKINTPSGKLSVVLGTASSSINNEFYLDDNAFIQPELTKHKKTFIFNLKYNGIYYGVYRINEAGTTKYLICGYGQNTSNRTICCQVSDMDDKATFIKNKSMCMYTQTLDRFFNNSMIYYDCSKTKSQTHKMFLKWGIIR